MQHIATCMAIASGTLQDAVTCARDFESAKSEANHAQANPAQMTSGNFRFRITQNWRLAMVVYQPIPSLLNSPSGSRTRNLDTSHHVLTNTIPLATISSDKSLAAIFLFELEENTPIPLFSGAALEEKLITAMYTDARVNGHPIKLILDSGSAGSIITKQLMEQLAASARIITADGATKTPIGEIDDFLFEVNGIVTSIKVLVIEATQYQALIGNDWLSKLICINCGKKLLSMGACCGNDEEYSTATRFYCHSCDNQPCLACGETLLDKGMWHDIPR
ncbi:hypothetical protein G9A89_008973 [Geosiphon pyriformis]|nr:hypothetical protein G9A89_008973 [Geosiphon pyriformis]